MTSIAFIAGMFPAVTETWMINQVSALKDRGIDVKVFSLKQGNTENISDTFYKYKMADYTYYLDMPQNVLLRFFMAIPKALHMFIKSPMSLARALNIRKYGRQAISLQLLFWSEPFLGKHFDLYHAHFGTIANSFLDIRYVLGIKQKMVTSFYGQDVSAKFMAKGDALYDQLKKECRTFIVMSDFMKKRLMEKGFAEHTISVLPIFGIDADLYPFKERTLDSGEAIQISTVGRFVEKKGFDDLLRATALARTKTDKKFACNIIGGGPLESRLHTLAKELNIQDIISFKGYMKIEDIINYFMNMHLYMQPSKTASDGDME